MKRLLVVVLAAMAACASQHASSGGGGDAGGGGPAVTVLSTDVPNPLVRLPQRLAQEIGVTQNTPATPSYLDRLALTCSSSDCQSAVRLCEQRTKACVLTPTAE
jgi:hypothetical protein